MKKLVVFDLDKTLCDLGKPIKNSTIKLLKILEKSCYIAVCSGKPCYYLCGVLRQVGLCNPIMIGENGATIQIGVDLPPLVYEMVEREEEKQAIAFIKSAIMEKVQDAFIQPNDVCFTPFPQNKKDFDTIENILENLPKNVVEKVDIYPQCDCFDIAPKGVDKGYGVSKLCDRLDIDNDNVIAVGDGINDIPMFKMAGYSIGINIDNEYTNITFQNIDNAIKYIIEKLLSD